MKLRKILALLMTAALVLTFCSCSKGDKAPQKNEQNEENQIARDYMTLLYSAADSFNPYEVKTDINRQIAALLYEPLFKLDNNFNLVNALAEKVEAEDKVYKVTLKDASFSDGSKVSADDVVYSYNLAKNSEQIYALELYEVSSVSALDSKTVTFTLTRNDKYFANLLKFPIIKAGSEKLTDSDSVALPPVGSGRYKVNDTKDALEINEHYYGKASSIKKINLINSPDSESVAHYVEVGAVDMYYTALADGSMFRTGGTKADINLNNLIYIGINQNYGPLTENAMRQALSSGIDRKKLCQNVYYNNAVSANGFFHPAWQEVSSVQNIQIEAKSQITIENLEEIGYNSLDNMGNRVNSHGTPLKFTLLVNSENRARVTLAQQIAAQLSSFGIKITVVEKNYENYISALESGNFQLFIGEARLTDNMDITPLIDKESSTAFGLSDVDVLPNGAEIMGADDIAKAFYNGENTISDVVNALQNEMPFVPVCFRSGSLFYNEKIENVVNSSASDIYFSIESYIFNN